LFCCRYSEEGGVSSINAVEKILIFNMAGIFLLLAFVVVATGILQRGMRNFDFQDGCHCCCRYSEEEGES
jgi:hypothetical protein